jgi:hypothetical protein
MQDPEDESTTYDETFELLSNHRRRYTLHYLEQNEGPVTLGDLSEQVAAWENDTTTEELSYDERKRVYTSLQQIHLPRMDDADVVVFDDREGVIELGPEATELSVYLEVVDEGDISWSAFYIGLSLLNAVVIATAVLGLPVLSSIPAYGVAVFVVTTFLVTSLAHYYVTQTEMALGVGDEPPDVHE